MTRACIVVADGDGPLTKLCGITILERLLRALQRCGVSQVTVLSGTPDLIAPQVNRPSWARSDLLVQVANRPAGELVAPQIADVSSTGATEVLIFRGDRVFDQRLLQRLVEQPAPSMLVDSAAPGEHRELTSAASEIHGLKTCGAVVVTRDWLAQQSGSFHDAVNAGVQSGQLGKLDVAALPVYDPSLRRNLRPYWFAAPADNLKGKAESLLLDSIQKGSQDLPAYVHAPIERFLVSYLCRTSIRPNHITMIWTVLAVVTTILFATGHLVAGIVTALMIGILDGLDGKQARLKVETTRGGKWEHHVDTCVEGVWPTALAWHFYSSGQLPTAFWWLALLLASELLDGLGKYGVYSSAAETGQEPGLLDRIVRLLGGRRNVYLWVLIVAVLLRRPAQSLIVMAIWETVTAAIDLVQAAAARNRAGNPL